MTAEWLSAGELSAIYGATPQAIRKRLRKEMLQSCGWIVREVAGRGGRSGVRYEVALSSLPELLQKAWREAQEMRPQLPAMIAEEPYKPRIATSAEATRALALYDTLKPAIDAQSRAKRGDPVPVKLAMAKHAGKPVIPGRVRYLDQGADIHELVPAGRLIEHRPAQQSDEAARARAAKKAETERLRRALRNGR